MEPTTTIGNIVVGRKDVDIALPSHVPGVHAGNEPKRIGRTSGVRGREADTRLQPAPPTRSTGINPEHRLPIDPQMPRLSPP